MDTVVTITQDEGKWFTSPVTTYQGPMKAIRDSIPRFERRTFGPGFLPRKASVEPAIPGTTVPNVTVNPYLDAIVRMPMKQGEPEIPVGVVSPSYSLLQHHELFDEILRTLDVLKIDPEEIVTEATLSRFGERMRLSLLFPERFNLEIADKDAMGLRLECFNSVDGSTKFMAVIGWLRFVCSNGLVGIADTYYRRRHNRTMELHEIAAVLKGGMAVTTKEAEAYRSSMKMKISDSRLKEWVDGPLASAWGVKAAMRTWHITREGHDVDFADPFQKGKPTEKAVIRGERVPGAVLPGDTVFAVTQAPSWLAKERRDVWQQLEWKQQIPEILKKLPSK